MIVRDHVIFRIVRSHLLSKVVFGRWVNEQRGGILNRRCTPALYNELISMRTPSVNAVGGDSLVLTGYRGCLAVSSWAPLLGFNDRFWASTAIFLSLVLLCLSLTMLSIVCSRYWRYSPSTKPRSTQLATSKNQCGPEHLPEEWNLACHFPSSSRQLAPINDGRNLEVYRPQVEWTRFFSTFGVRTMYGLFCPSCAHLLALYH